MVRRLLWEFWHRYTKHPLGQVMFNGQKDDFESTTGTRGSPRIVFNFTGTKDQGSIPGVDPKRFQDSINFVFVGECISCAEDTHLATDLTSQ